MRRRKLAPEQTHSKVSLTLRVAGPRELGPCIRGLQSIQSPLGHSAVFFYLLFLLIATVDSRFFFCALKL